MSPEYLFADFEIYIGDNADYTLNTLCPGGPFMKDQFSTTNSGYYQYDPTVASGSWRYLSETWCNLQGRYTHIVKDYSTIFANYGFYEASLCSVGVMGTKYVRSAPISTTITVIQD